MSGWFVAGKGWEWNECGFELKRNYCMVYTRSGGKGLSEGEFGGIWGGWELNRSGNDGRTFHWHYQLQGGYRLYIHSDRFVRIAPLIAQNRTCKICMLIASFGAVACFNLFFNRIEIALPSFYRPDLCESFGKIYKRMWNIIKSPK